MDDMSGKEEGFRDEKYVIIPTESFAEYMEHPLIKAMYLTDVGFFRRPVHIIRNEKMGQTSIF